MEINVELVKQLREITMASLKDCKECLVEANWDITLAQELLKKKWIASAGKKWDRETKEGKLWYLVKDGKIAVLRLWCETDFVAKNELFDELIAKVLEIAIQYEFVSFSELDASAQETINNTVAEVIGKLGENMKIAELFVKQIPTSQVYAYTHAGSKLLAVVYYNADSEMNDEVKKVALQIAAMDPAYLSIDSIPADTVATMKAEFEAEVKASGKPEAVVANIVAGKLNKRYSETVLLEQGYIGDESMKIKDIVAGKADLVSFDRIAFAA